jgi:hypothetical protein
MISASLKPSQTPNRVARHRGHQLSEPDEIEHPPEIIPHSGAMVDLHGEAETMFAILRGFFAVTGTN